MTEEKREAIELVLSNRLFLYSLMHKLFGREPDAEMLNILTDEHTGEAFSLLSEEKKDIMDRTASFLDEIREEKENPLEVRNTYRRFGLIPEGYPHVADDSLALELHFMALLAQRSLDAFYAGKNEDLAADLTGSEEFLDKHLLVWIPKFLERMKGARSNILYPQMCLVLDEFLRKDAGTVREILKALE